MLQKLPIGLQTFDKIRAEDYLYVDKTQYLYDLITLTGGYYFLSRPRRFGKSLTLSTLKAIFNGAKELFDGLWIQKHYDWEKSYPVVHLQMAKLDYQALGLDAALQRALHEAAAQYAIELTAPTLKTLFAELLEKLAATQGQVVLLVDEYDKPLIDYLDDIEQAKTNQQILKNFYSVIKDSDPYLRFLLITGVSKFSKVSIFSDLNNLLDISRHPRFATMLGYTQAELEHYFAERIEPLAQQKNLERDTLLEKIRHYYNGYRWDVDQPSLYNPYSILSFMETGRFHNFWFETGTPTFLIRLMRRDGLYDLSQLEVNGHSFISYDIEHLQAIPILFQTGYLTIKSEDEYGLYRLDYPNAEVKESLLQYLISDLRFENNAALNTPLVVHLHKAFQANDLERVITIIKSIFKKIPSHIFIKEAEAYYHSLIYLVFFYLGQYSEAEVNDSTGRIDCVVKTSTHIYIIEFKLGQSADAALKQIRDKNYAGAYLADPREKVLIGINFSSQEKTVDDWRFESLQ
ncbi:ATP-binding protein [Thiothrix nivea]|uniref:AAA-ATPase-like protein n=1 Tax=Thiothrix nivea (strain ATCC 35100 / DSM 5205 / JP2) TaxID=870187 RepID=A0A656HIQ6_THINJ|nr:ATP-binding protein [Thiothrix nivea]EIJ36808.1 AAA-ATPase-like protein [Thiothrix nivea DSM 5205]